MILETYKPQNEILRKYIDCFYTLKRTDDEPGITYLGFPSNTVFLTLCKNARVTGYGDVLNVSACANEDIESVLIIDTKKQAPCIYTGACDEITIYFKPLGINRFLKEPLFKYLTGCISNFSPYEDYQSSLRTIFQGLDDQSRLFLLEEYLLSKLTDFRHPFLDEALHMILNDTLYPIKINDIARFCKKSRTTLHKEFLKHLGTNPHQFLKIERFRNAVKMFTSNATKEQLVDIVYMAEYFDQSHMAKDFKSLTGYTPKHFFSKLSQMKNGTINWIFS